ncbi:DUF4179 domain-containing protein [Paenibacillus sp. SYP-B3998]|uniref:DUF4179 domain-containing protein n=1 Tax=Paenibacillus sp. SYP-B3998 TaxID=2678564 RepID=A0A6G3ZTW5_9BACL|nr:DUF4179 domain-containing protein [Paenibacillus sp. SYP-B3998]NEW05656.1 DUF4179 domain-containing protein [Paenibacillus sp. SYP-B3998]
MDISKKINEALAEQLEETRIPEEIDQRVKESFIQFHKKKEKNKMKKKFIILSLAAVILVPTGMYAMNTSYFSNDVDLNGLVDKGVKRAVSQQLSIPIDQKITDKGITVHLKELYVENKKILIHYNIEQQDGTPVPYEFDTTGLNVITDGKRDGKQVENPTYQESGLEGFSVLSFFGTEKTDNLPFYLTDGTGREIKTGIADKDKPEGIIAFVTDGSILPKSINLNVNINRIGKTKGSWKTQFPIDQSKAEQATEAAR